MSVKRYAIAAGAAALVFSGVYGAAAALPVSAGALQTGQDTLICDSDGVAVSGYDFESDGALVSGFDVVGVNDACVGSELIAVVLNSAGNPLADATVAITAPGTVPVRFDAVPAAEAESVQITIN